MYQIEKNVPIPPRKHGDPRYPFATMEVGDSFLIPWPKSGVKPHQRGVMGSNAYGALASAKRLGRVPQSFTILSRTEPDGLRIWRTK